MARSERTTRRKGLEQRDNGRGDVVRADEPMAVLRLRGNELDGEGGRGEVVGAEEVARQGDGRGVCGGTGDGVVDFILDARLEKVFVRDERCGESCGEEDEVRQGHEGGPLDWVDVRL